MDAGDVAIGRQRLDGVLVTVMSERPVEEAFECGWTKLQREFAGIAGDGIAGEDGMRIE